MGEKAEAATTETAKASAPARGETRFFKDIYPLIEPYAYGAISSDPETGQLKYTLIEPVVSDVEKAAIKRIKELLTEELVVNLDSFSSREKAAEYLKEAVADLTKRYKIRFERESRDKINYYLVRDLVYLGVLEPLLRDHLIEDISCDGVGVPIYIWHREYESMPTNIAIDNADDLDRLVIKIAYLCGKHISVAQPIVDASLPDGSRVVLSFSNEVTKRGSTITVRKFRSDPLTVIDLIKFKTISVDMAAYFWYVIENKKSILVTGGTASGKTTTLNSLAMFIRPEHKIVSIEDTAELNLKHDNWVQAVSRTGFGVRGGTAEISLFDLLKMSMRQRPDFIIVGEVRGSEAYTLFQALATGHGGISTLHADSVSSVIHRLEEKPMEIPRALMPGLNVVIVQSIIKLGDRSVRRAITTSEIVGVDPKTNELLINDVYRWNPSSDNHAYLGRSQLLEQMASMNNVPLASIKDELERRKTVLQWMVKNDIRRHSDVANFVRDYYFDPEKTYNNARLGLMI